MKPNLEYKETIEEMKLDVSRLQDHADQNIKPALKDIGEEISRTVRRVAPVSDITRTGYVHIKDDVVYKVKKSRKTKENYVSISGGKATGPKWHVVNDGHVTIHGDFVPGTYFVDKAEALSDIAVEGIVDDFLRSIVDE